LHNFIGDRKAVRKRETVQFACDNGPQLWMLVKITHENVFDIKPHLVMKRPWCKISQALKIH